MLKDLRLAMEAARSVDSYTPMGAHAEELYTRFAEALGGSGKDFSAIIKMIDDSLHPAGPAPPPPPCVQLPQSRHSPYLRHPPFSTRPVISEDLPFCIFFF